MDIVTQPNDQEVVRFFHFANKGDATITIKEVNSSCGCTTAKLEKFTYAPGETGEIKVVFTIGSRAGVQDKTIYITTDEPGGHPAVLTLHVVIPELFSYDPHVVYWIIGEEPKEKVVTVLARSSLRLASVTVPTPVADASLRIVSVAEGAKCEIYIKPNIMGKNLTIPINGVVTFSDGMKKDFVIYALVRR